MEWARKTVLSGRRPDLSPAAVLFLLREYVCCGRRRRRSRRRRSRDSRAASPSVDTDSDTCTRLQWLRTLAEAAAPVRRRAAARRRSAQTLPAAVDALEALVRRPTSRAKGLLDAVVRRTHALCVGAARRLRPVRTASLRDACGGTGAACAPRSGGSDGERRIRRRLRRQLHRAPRALPPRRACTPTRTTAGPRSWRRASTMPTMPGALAASLSGRCGRTPATMPPSFGAGAARVVRVGAESAIEFIGSFRWPLRTAQSDTAVRDL